MPTLARSVTPDEISNALTAILQNQIKLSEEDARHRAILQRIAKTLDDLTAWLQTPPSSELPDLLRDLAAKAEATNVKVAALGIKMDHGAIAVQWIVNRLS